MLRADGLRVSQSSIYRTLKRQGLLQPARYHAERRALATARKQTFWNPPARRNRVWQTDVTRIEITSGSVWWIAPVTDYYAKVCFAAPVSTRTSALDAITALRVAIESAEQMMGHSLLDDCTDPETGEITPVTIVTDNGPCYKSSKFLVFIASHPELRHVRTRHHSPETNGVDERFNQSLKYEHLYRKRSPTARTSSMRSRAIAISTTTSGRTSHSTCHRFIPIWQSRAKTYFQVIVSRKVDTGTLIGRTALRSG
jgi:transposase InsO family protein